MIIAMRVGASSNPIEAAEKKPGPWVTKFMKFSAGAKSSQCSK